MSCHVLITDYDSFYASQIIGNPFRTRIDVLERVTTGDDNIRCIRRQQFTFKSSRWKCQSRHVAETSKDRSRQGVDWHEVYNLELRQQHHVYRKDTLKQFFLAFISCRLFETILTAFPVPFDSFIKWFSDYMWDKKLLFSIVKKLSSTY